MKRQVTACLAKEQNNIKVKFKSSKLALGFGERKKQGDHVARWHCTSSGRSHHCRSHDTHSVHTLHPPFTLTLFTQWTCCSRQNIFHADMRRWQYPLLAPLVRCPQMVCGCVCVCWLAYSSGMVRNELLCIVVAWYGMNGLCIVVAWYGMNWCG